MNELINKLYDDNRGTIRMGISLGVILIFLKHLDKSGSKRNR